MLHISIPLRTENLGNESEVNCNFLKIKGVGKTSGLAEDDFLDKLDKAFSSKLTKDAAKLMRKNGTLYLESSDHKMIMKRAGKVNKIFDVCLGNEERQKKIEGQDHLNKVK